MLRKCTVLVAVLVVVQSASFQGRRSIPVEVRYERLEHNFLSNLSEKVQLSPEELQENQLRLEKLKAAQEEELAKKNHITNSIKNLNEKVQLSPEELLQASKHIPIHNSLRTNQDVSDLERLGELRNEPASKIEQLQGIIETGLENLRKNFQPKNNDIAPSKEEWERLETEVRDYFTEEKNKLAKQDAGNPPQIIQGWTNWFQNVTSNFVGSFQQQNGTSGDEGTSPGPLQNFIGYFTGGAQNIIAAVQGQNSQNGNSTVLGDNENGGPSNFFGNIVSGAQQFIQNGQQQLAQVIGQNSSQSDEGTGSQGGTPFQNVVQSLGSTVTQIFQGGQKPQGSEDENSSQKPGGFLQQVQTVFGQNFNSAIQNLQNQFAPSANKPASGSVVTEAPSKQSEDSGEKEEATETTATEAEKSEEMTATE